MRAPLGRYVVRRRRYALPTLLGVTLAVFLLVRLIPGGPARLIAGLLASDDEVQRLRVELGLDRPMPEQYARFLASVLAGNFGLSAVTRTPVIEEIGIRMRATLTLAVTSTALAVAAGLSAGVLAAAYQNTAGGWPVRMAALGGGSVAGAGLGRLLVSAITARDYPVIQGIVIVFAAMFVVVNLVTDLLYVAVDPRIRYG